MAIKNIIEIGHPLLKQSNKKITQFHSQQTKRLIKNLMDTMRKNDLIGIAAPQIGENYQVFLTQPRKTQSRNAIGNDVMRIYINPKITYVSDKMNIIFEGCGCMPQSSIFGPVERPSEIEICAFDQTGRQFRLRCDGILARVIQHEYDHLQGIEFLEKVTDNRKIVSTFFYRKNIKNSLEQKHASTITKIDFSYVI